MRGLKIALCAAVLAVSACATAENTQKDAIVTASLPRPADARPVMNAAARVVDVVVGQASWYGAKFQGRPTASGEPFDMNGLTAAHRTLPFGTRVRVVNEENGRSVVVRVNDRGPFAGKRIIDLSRKAADAIGLRNKGVGRVKVEVLAGA